MVTELYTIYKHYGGHFGFQVTLAKEPGMLQTCILYQND